MHDDGPMRLDDPQAGASKRGQGRSNMIGTRPLHGQAKQQEKAVDKTTYTGMHDAVIGKYRGRSVFFSTCNLVGVALCVLLIGRSALSNLWILLVLAISTFLIYLQSLNASNSYIEEAQRLMRQEVSGYVHGCPPHAHVFPIFTYVGRCKITIQAVLRTREC